MISPKILVIHQGAIGDFILSLPALQTIKYAFPEGSFEMLGYPAILSLARSSFACTIRSVDWAAASTLHDDYENVSVQMRHYLTGFERVFIFSAQEQSAFIHNVQSCNRAAVHLRTFPDTAQHVVDFQLAQLAALGFAITEPVPRLCASCDDQSRAGAFLLQNPFGAVGPMLAVHPGSGGRQKCWPAASFHAVMHDLHAQRQASFMIIEGPAEEKTAGVFQKSLAGLPHMRIRNLELRLVASILSQSALFIGNDSGITHMAAALGIPTVAVFGPTDPSVWAPRGKSVCIVRECDVQGQWRWPGPEVVLQSARGLLGG